MSLTSASEEDIATIMKQGGRPLPLVTKEEEDVAEAMKIKRHRQRRRHHPTQRQQIRQQEINGVGANENIVTGISDEQRCSSNVDDDEWDYYYDNIVLLVTIFATSTTGAAASSTASLPRWSDSSIASSTSWAVQKGTLGSGGEAIVMELLSTREPICPRKNSSLEPNPSTDENIGNDRANKVDGGRMTNHTRIFARRVLY